LICEVHNCMCYDVRHHSDIGVEVDS
jgi:hypothetical protein